MVSPRAEIARERRRQIQVRKAFEAGLDPSAGWTGRDRATFYLACADYLLVSMDRLHEQDQVIHDLLAARIPPVETEAHERLATLRARQARSRALLDDFRGLALQLRKSGTRGIEPFEKGAREFADTFKGLLLPRKNPFFRHTDHLFDDGDWMRVAGVTPVSLAEEARLFAGVQRTAPAGVDPDKFTAEHLPG